MPGNKTNFYLTSFREKSNDDLGELAQRMQSGALSEEAQAALAQVARERGLTVRTLAVIQAQRQMNDAKAYSAQVAARTKARDEKYERSRPFRWLLWKVTGLVLMAVGLTLGWLAREQGLENMAIAFVVTMAGTWSLFYLKD